MLKSVVFACALAYLSVPAAAQVQSSTIVVDLKSPEASALEKLTTTIRGIAAMNTQSVLKRLGVKRVAVVWLDESDHIGALERVLVNEVAVTLLSRGNDDGLTAYLILDNSPNFPLVQTAFDDPDVVEAAEELGIPALAKGRPTFADRWGPVTKAFTAR